MENAAELKFDQDIARETTTIERFYKRVDVRNQAPDGVYKTVEQYNEDVKNGRANAGKMTFVHNGRVYFVCKQ